MGFWQNVEEECEYRGISRKELAAVAKFSVNTISTGIKRDGMPEADLALRISKALNVPLEQLLSSNASIQRIDKSEFEAQQKLLALYMPYIQKIEHLPVPTKKALLTIIDSIG